MQLDDYSAPYSVTASGLSNSEHLVEAQIIDAGGTPLSDVGAYDQAADVAIGDSYVAIGDGMTYGYADDRPEDDNSQDERTMLGGYTSILADALTVAKGYPVAVANAAVGGTASGDGAASISPFLERIPMGNACWSCTATTTLFAAYQAVSGWALRIQATQAASSTTSNAS